MEFIITGLFIIFFSYILLYSLYNFLFKRYMIEGLETESDNKSEKSTDADTNGDKKQKGNKSTSDDKSKAEDASNLKTAQKAQSMASDANDQVAANNAKHKNATFDNANSLVKKPSNKIT